MFGENSDKNPLKQDRLSHRKDYELTVSLWFSGLLVFKPTIIKNKTEWKSTWYSK